MNKKSLENVERVQRIRKKAIRKKAMNQNRDRWVPGVFITAGIVMIMCVCMAPEGRSEARAIDEITEAISLEETTTFAANAIEEATTITANAIEEATKFTAHAVEEAATITANVDQENTKPLLEPIVNEIQETYIGELKVAAYCGCQICNGKSGAYTTWTGQSPIQGVTVAADLSLFKINDMLRIGSNVYRVDDKVASGANEVIRLYFDDHAEAVAFGRQTFSVYKIEPEEEQSEFYAGMFQVTGYCSCDKCCGTKKDKRTKSGTIPKSRHTIAADPEVLPMGTKVEIDGVIYTVEDTGSLVKGNVIDIYFDTHEEAMAFGRQEKKVYFVQN